MVNKMGIDIEKGKYFVSDQSINSVDEDFFGHNDFALTIENIIKTQPIPHNIAIVGEWGLGKSSILELVKSRMNGKTFDGKKYHIIEINAWKYEREIFQRVFLKRSWIALGGTEEDHLEKLTKILSQSVVKESCEEQSEPCETKKNLRQKLKEWIKKLSSLVAKLCEEILVIYLVIVFFAMLSAVILCLFNKELIKNQILYVFLENIYKISFMSIISTAVLNFIESYKTKESRTFTITTPVKSADEYEALLKERLPENGKDVLIAIIDDIDRLNPKKMLEALDALKAFSDFKKCIFIVPFDDHKIKKAYKEAKSSDDEFMACDLMLDKLFQYKIDLPPLVKQDLIPYARKLVDSKAPDLRDAINEVSPRYFEDTILPILVPTHIKTPRKLKKIINCFATNYLLIKSRSDEDMSGINTKLKLTVDSVMIQTIAFLSVLQSEFSVVYEKLLKYPTIMEDTIKDYERETKKTEDESEYGVLKNNLLKNGDLIGFLIRSKHIINIDKELLMHILYMSESIAALKSEGPYYEVVVALSNGNATDAFELIKDKDNNSYFLQQEILSSGLIPSVEKQYILAVHSMFEKLNGDKEQLADTIVERTVALWGQSYYNEYESVNVKDMLNIIIFSKSNQKSYYANLIAIKIIGLPLKGKNEVEQENIKAIINFIIKNQDQLDSQIEEEFRKRISALPALDDSEYDFKHFIEDLDASLDKVAVVKRYYPSKPLNQVAQVAAYEEEESSIIKLMESLVDEYAENQNYREICMELDIAMQSFVSFKALKDKIIPLKDEFSMDNLNLFIEDVCRIPRTSENSKLILLFIAELNCEYDNDVVVELDLVLSDCLAYNEIEDVVVQIAKQNLLGEMTETISALNKNIFSSGQRNNLFLSIFENYSEEQKQEFSELFANSVAVSQKDIEIKKVSELIESCKDIKSLLKWFNPDIDDLIENLGKNYTYEKWAEEVVVVIGNLIEGASEPYIDEYYTYLQSIFAENPDISVKAWSYLSSENETEEQTEFIVKSVLSLEREVYEDGFRTILPRKEQCIALDLDSYCLWLYAGLTEPELFDDAVESLENMEELSSLSSFFSIMCQVEGQNIERLESIFVKHTNNSENIEKEVANCLLESDEFKAEIFTSVLKKTKIEASKFYRATIKNMNISDAKIIERVIQAYLLQKQVNRESILQAMTFLATKGDDINIDTIYPSLEKIKGKCGSNKQSKAIFNSNLEIMLKLISEEAKKERIRALLK